MYDKEYCIDMINSPRWLKKLDEKTPNFFSLYMEDGCYYSQTLKRSENLINFAQINQEIPKVKKKKKTNIYIYVFFFFFFNNIIK